MNVSPIYPLDQPTGNQRLLDVLKGYLNRDDLRAFGFVVAFAKSGPLYRLQPQLTLAKGRGAKLLGIFGIDHRGTSVQALTISLGLFHRCYVTTHPKVSFHPKIYFAHCESEGFVYLGSNNLTVGGTETNFEAGLLLRFELPKERENFNDYFAGVTSLLPTRCPATKALDDAMLKSLIEGGYLLDETSSTDREKKKTSHAHKATSNPIPGAEDLKIIPPSPIPTSVSAPKKKKIKVTKKGATTILVTQQHFTPSALAIQIIPHHNGEIFLSKTAVNQCPTFFGWPFKGKTTPKKSGNPSYPERTPDPVVNIVVIGKNGKKLKALKNYNLNTVYYEPKAEIRITASPIISVTPDYSLMLMKGAPNDPTIDFELEIHTPDSPEFDKWMSVCDQTMPTGGAAKARKFGWL